MDKSNEYNHLKIEQKWQKEWENQQLYKVENSVSGKTNYYALVEFTYPSGNLHVGHWYAFAVPDIFARYKRMQGFNVLYPMGFDAFGLPAENAAIKLGADPKDLTYKQMDQMRKQFYSMGAMFDWSREVVSCDPAYYKWTQWMFNQFYKNDLAYRANTKVNWCPKDKTVLANEQVIDGKCDRCGSDVVQKDQDQWMLRITKYADRLIDDLAPLNWPNAIKDAQINWIGRSEGSEISFQLLGASSKPKKVLVGTRNKAKVEMLKECFPKNAGIEFISLNDIPEVDDSMLVEGADFEENARQKAEFYFEKTGIPTISTDQIFWSEKWTKDNGIIVHARKEANPNSDRATDEEVIAFFQNWIKENGPSKSHFIYAIGYADENGVKSCISNQRDYIMQEKQSAFSEGYPMESLLVDAQTGQSKFEQPMLVRYDELVKSLENFISTNSTVKVFTTRADTLFGVTYVVLAPEHPLTQVLVSSISNRDEVIKYIEQTKKKSELDRQQSKEKTGVCLEGVFVTNPANGEKIPVWIADYVLAGYGTGAVMAVPAHDERDFEFAKKYNLPIKKVIAQETGEKRKNEEFKDGGAGVVFDPETQKYAVGKWKSGYIAKSNMQTVSLFAGGVDTSIEDMQTGVTREVTEESGFYDFKHIEEIERSYPHYHNSAKNVNRYARAVCYLYILNSREQKPLKLEAHENFEVAWMSAQEIKDIWMAHNSDKTFDHYLRFLDESVAMAIELGYDKTSDPKVFKATAMTDEGILENSEPIKNLIFDFDGVLADTYEANLEARIKVGWASDKEDSVQKTFKYFTVRPHHARGHTHTEDEVKVMLAKTIEFGECVKGCGFNLFDGFISEIKKIKNARIAVVSSGSIIYVHEGMEKSGLKIEGIQTFEDSMSKEEKLEHFANKWNVSLSDIYYFTDANSDVYELQDLLDKSKIIGCSWGYIGFDELVKALPENQILKEFSDIHKVFANQTSFDGLHSAEARKKITEFVGGKFVSTYRLRDWGISRQRYWGTPIPIVYDPQGKAHAIPDEHLPWILPTDVDHTPDGTAPLARSKELLERTEKIFGAGWKPEVETMDTFVDSSWYFYRYLDNKNDGEFADAKKMNDWMPINLYMGGAEHTTMHLLYSRFWTKALHDLGFVKDSEAYAIRRNRGLILGPDGNKMSKSKGNVIDPDEIVQKLGADTVRLYLAFMGPYGITANYPWDPNGVVGVRRFLEKVWRLSAKIENNESNEKTLFNKTIKGITEDIEEYKFNTAISKMMILCNAWEKSESISIDEFKTLLKLLSPFAPHMTEELWHVLGESTSIHTTSWPIFDTNELTEENITLGIQINGKARAEITVAMDEAEESVKQKVMQLPQVIKYTEGQTIKKFLYIPGKIINIVL